MALVVNLLGINKQEKQEKVKVKVNLINIKYKENKVIPNYMVPLALVDPIKIYYKLK